MNLNEQNAAHRTRSPLLKPSFALHRKRSRRHARALPSSRASTPPSSRVPLRPMPPGHGEPAEAFGVAAVVVDEDTAEIEAVIFEAEAVAAADDDVQGDSVGGRRYACRGCFGCMLAMRLRARWTQADTPAAGDAPDYSGFDEPASGEPSSNRCARAGAGLPGRHGRHSGARRADARMGSLHDGSRSGPVARFAADAPVGCIL